MKGVFFLQYLLKFLFVISLFYFIFHSIYGKNGLVSYFKVNKQLVQFHSILDNLSLKKIEIEEKVNLLKRGDIDFIEEQAKRNLGVAAPDEKIFILKDDDSKD